MGMNGTAVKDKQVWQVHSKEELQLAAGVMRWRLAGC